MASSSLIQSKIEWLQTDLQEKYKSISLLQQEVLSFEKDCLTTKTIWTMEQGEMKNNLNVDSSCIENELEHKRMQNVYRKECTSILQERQCHFQTVYVLKKHN